MKEIELHVEDDCLGITIHDEDGGPAIIVEDRSGANVITLRADDWLQLWKFGNEILKAADHGWRIHHSPISKPQTS